MSCPNGVGTRSIRGCPPLTKTFTSVPHVVAATTFTRSSPSPGSGTAARRSSTYSGPRRYTTRWRPGTLMIGSSSHRLRESHPPRGSRSGPPARSRAVRDEDHLERLPGAGQLHRLGKAGEGKAVSDEDRRVEPLALDHAADLLPLDNGPGVRAHDAPLVLE